MFQKPLRPGVVLSDGREIMQGTYMIRQLETIYAIAWLTPWIASSVTQEFHQILGSDLVIHLNRIWVVEKYQGRRYGHELLRTVCREADRFKNVMTLDCDPDKAQNYSWIHAMYEHAGFKDDPEIGGMVRWPRATQTGTPRS